MIVVTSNQISGKNIISYHGVAKGVVVREPNTKEGLKAAFSLRFKNDKFTQSCEQTCEQSRQQAYEVMVEDAKRLGANAVIGMRFDSAVLFEGSTEVIAYGTAITI